MPWSRSKSATRRARFSSIGPRYVPASTVRADPRALARPEVADPARPGPSLGRRSPAGACPGRGRTWPRAAAAAGALVARRVVADERSDHFPEQHAVVLLQEVPGPRDHGMFQARRSWDRAFQDAGHAAGDGVA